jgi:hypothetical protein
MGGIGGLMKDAADWDYLINYTDALFYRLAVGIACRANMSLEDAHEELWSSFEQGHFKLKPGDGDDDDSVEVVPCDGDDDRRAAMEQNQPLAGYRQRVIEAAVAAA